MTNSNCHLQPDKILYRLIDLLSEEKITNIIDDPIDMALDAFRLKITTPITHKEFNRVLAAFMRHIFKTAILLPRHLSDRRALAEAIFLLKRHYQNEGVNGYEGALVDTIGTGMDHIELILSKLGEIVKEVEREKYKKWVFIDNYLILSFMDKKCVVSAYLNQNQLILPPELVQMDPARLIDDFYMLLTNHISSKSLMDHPFLLSDTPGA